MTMQKAHCVLAIIGSLLVLPSFSTAQERELIVEIVSFGIYERRNEAAYVNPNSPSGITRVSQGGVLEQTTKIPAVLGTKFGYCFVIHGFPAQFNGEVRLLKVVTHPPIRKPDGIISTGYSTPTEFDVVNGRVDDCTGYILNREYELSRGTWSFTLRAGDRVLATKEFQVELP
jgi:hypothetical protein